MRKIIDGKVYDTETATLLAEDSHGYARDFSAWYEALYRTPRGAYMLHGKGGPMSHWSRPGPGQGEVSGGSDILAYTEAGARKWMERHGTAEEYEAAFGAAEQA